MVRPASDHQGKRYGLLVVIEQEGRDSGGKVLWRCSCDCGRSILVRSGDITSGNTTSCGCKNRVSPLVSGAFAVPGGMRKAPLYSVWVGMLRRCQDPQYVAFHNYGGRGIEVCARWQNVPGEEPTGFLNFVSDMGDRPEETTLDRIDNEGDYAPDNCRWADKWTQANNRRRRVA